MKLNLDNIKVGRGHLLVSRQRIMQYQIEKLPDGYMGNLSVGDHIRADKTKHQLSYFDKANGIRQFTDYHIVAESDVLYSYKDEIFQ